MYQYQTLRQTILQQGMWAPNASGAETMPTPPAPVVDYDRAGARRSRRFNASVGCGRGHIYSIVRFLYFCLRKLRRCG